MTPVRSTPSRPPVRSSPRPPVRSSPRPPVRSSPRPPVRSSPRPPLGSPTQGRPPSRSHRDEDPRNVLRSTGEKLISEFLQSEDIHFVHEYPVALIDEQNQIRLWYPDFFLPKLSIVIEYLGMKGKPDYEKSVRRKTKLFRHLRIDFILITPKRLTRPDWKHYIIGKILEIMESKDSEYYKMKGLAKKYKYKPRDHEIGDDWGLD